MKKQLLPFLLLPFISSCSQSVNKAAALQKQVDSLQNKLSGTYKPGFGEFMLNVQTHHIKLWFAGANKNWMLANFELGEIRETVESIQKYETDRIETPQLKMIEPPLDSLDAAIQQKNPAKFKDGFALLTATCNNCHQAVNFGFNVIRIPETENFNDQIFKPEPAEK